MNRQPLSNALLSSAMITNSTLPQNHGMRALSVDDSNITQAQLLAGGYDILVCSYEFFAQNGKDMHQLQENIQMVANDQNNIIPQPRRSTSGLQTEMWKRLNMPFKIAVLDEAQRVNKREKFRHEAIKNHLHARSFCILSGTLPHNKWHNMSAYIDFGQSHPFDTHNKFLHTFSSFDQSNQIESPSVARIRLLQKFLQAILIARPASILNLKECKKYSVPFKLFKYEASVVTILAEKYARLSGIDSKTGAELAQIGAVDSSGIFGLAVKAQMAAFHPMIAAEIDTVELRDFNEDYVEEGFQDLAEEDLGGKSRDDWLAKVKARPNITKESGRLTTLMNLYKWLRETYPDEKMIIFSSSLKFLDIVDEAYKRDFKINPIRFDGTVPTRKRKTVERTFETCGPEIPFLITINAGKFSWCHRR